MDTIAPTIAPTIEQLQKQIEYLNKELTFYKTIHEHYNSLVGNMYVKHQDGQKKWIDKQNVTSQTLQQLDKDEEVLQWLDEIQCMKYRDS